MTQPFPLPGLGILSLLQQDNILLSVLERCLTPLTSITIPELGSNLRFVFSPMININVLYSSKDMSRICGHLLANVISRNGALLRMMIYCDDKLLCDENVTLNSINCINWSRFTEIYLSFPRMRSLSVPRFFPNDPTGRYGNFIMAKAITPPSYYSTMPILEFIYDYSYLTINPMPIPQYTKYFGDLDPRHYNPVLCTNEDCGCNVSTIRANIIQTGVSGKLENFLSPTPGIEALEQHEILALPAWDTGCSPRECVAITNTEIISFVV